jgi:hypothetical protein
VDHDLVTERRPSRAVWVVLLVVAAGHVSLFPRVADLDGFYHVGHAAAYLDGSFFDTSLPWATKSVIGDVGADLWWGFHVLLAPIALVEDPGVAISLGALLLTTILGLTVYWVFHRHGVSGAGWWAAAFLVAVPNVFFRYLMLRPHVLTIAVSIALLSLLVRGRWWHVLLLSALVSWLHLTLFWMAPGLVAAYALTRIPLVIATDPEEGDHSVPLAPAFGAAVLGTLLGWLLRPHPLATASLLDVQLIRLFAQKATEEPLLFAPELLPIGVAEIVRTAWLFAALWIASIALTVRGLGRGLVGRLGLERSTLLLAAGLVSSAFLALAILSARRAMVQWVAFGFLTLPFAWMAMDRGRGLAGVIGRRRRTALAAAIVLATTHLAWAGWRHALNLSRVAFPGDAFEEVASFLAGASEPGDVVFHGRWDNFAPLFAHNRVNRYLGGMDPIFQFVHDSRSYWEYFYLSADINVEWTCDAYPCPTGVATDSYTVIRDHFGARWVVVEPRRNPRLSLHLLEDTRYELAFETQREAVFEVLPPPTGSGERP